MPESNDGTTIIVESATGETMFLDLSFVYELIVNGVYTKHQEIDHCDIRHEYHVHDVTDDERKRMFDTAATTIMQGVVKTELYGGVFRHHDERTCIVLHHQQDGERHRRIELPCVTDAGYEQPSFISIPIRQIVQPGCRDSFRHP